MCSFLSVNKGVLLFVFSWVLLWFSFPALPPGLDIENRMNLGGEKWLKYPRVPRHQQQSWGSPGWEPMLGCTMPGWSPGSDFGENFNNNKVNNNPISKLDTRWARQDVDIKFYGWIVNLCGERSRLNKWIRDHFFRSLPFWTIMLRQASYAWSCGQSVTSSGLLQASMEVQFPM